MRMAVAARGQVNKLRAQWVKRGFSLGFGVGIATGYATVGLIGFERRLEYGVIGSVTNLAARLCSEASSDQILIPQRFFNSVENLVEAECVGERTLKGFHRPVCAYNILGLKESE